MPRKKHPSSPGTKLLKLFNKLLLDGQEQSLTALASYLSCSSQTVLRLVAVIEETLGISLKVEDDRKRDRQNWYRMDSKKYWLFGKGIGNDDLRYLAICRDLATGMLPDEMIRKVDSALVSLLMAEPNAVNPETSKIDREFLYFTKGHIDYSGHTGVIMDLIRARSEKSVCFVKYRPGGKPRGEYTQHFFAPGRIVSMSNALYVLGAGVEEDDEFKQWTHLAVHRIALLSVTDRKYSFEIPDASPGTFGLPMHEPKTFRLWFSAGTAADYVRERSWGLEERKDDLEDGSLVFTITTRSELELKSWALSFGDACKILDDGSGAPAMEASE
ncbi:MAG: WYL domain-containing protein [Deltaproteobacteria bacterium]|nr:WYL domain-containing protein [Deltaproteobacteria bacterium]